MSLSEVSILDTVAKRVAPLHIQIRGRSPGKLDVTIKLSSSPFFFPPPPQSFTFALSLLSLCQQFPHFPLINTSIWAWMRMGRTLPLFPLSLTTFERPWLSWSCPAGYHSLHASAPIQRTSILSVLLSTFLGLLEWSVCRAPQPVSQFSLSDSPSARCFDLSVSISLSFPVTVYVCLPIGCSVNKAVWLGSCM